MSSHTFDLFEPIVFAIAMLFALFCVRPIVMLATHDLTYQSVIDIAPEFERVTLLGMLGTVAFVAAYEINGALRGPQSAPRSGFRTHIDPPATKRAIRVLVALGALVFFVRLAAVGDPVAVLKLLSQGRSAASAGAQVSSYLDDGPLLAAVGATILMIAAAKRPTPREKILGIILSLAPVAAFFLLGNRRLILPSIGTPLIAYYLARARRPRWQAVAVLVPIAFLFLATIPLERSLGARQNSGGTLKIFERSFTAPFKPVVDFFTSYDTAMAPDLGLEVAALRKPSDYYFGRATIGDLLIAPIPSALIPGKPQSARNSLLIRLFGEPCTAISGTRNQCPDFSTIGTFYQDFWIVGVVLGMLIVGAFSQALWGKFQRDQSSMLSIVLAASWTVSLPIVIRGGFNPSFQWWLEFIVPAYLVIRYIKNRTIVGLPHASAFGAPPPPGCPSD